MEIASLFIIVVWVTAIISILLFIGNFVYNYFNYKPKVGDIVIVTEKDTDPDCDGTYHYTGIITSVKGSVIVVDAMLYGTLWNQNAPLDTGITDNKFDLSDKNVSVKLLVKAK
jgi:hypothetical protein